MTDICLLYGGENHIDGLVQDWIISIAKELDMPQSCTKLSIYRYIISHMW